MREEHGRNKVWLIFGVLAGAGCGLLGAVLVGLLAITVRSPAPGDPLAQATAVPSAEFPVLAPPLSTRQALAASGDLLPATFTPAASPTLATTSEARPTPEATEALQPAGDGPQGRIVFTCFIAGFDDICSMDARGGEVQQLTDFPATDFYPEWGPSGETVVFSSRRNGTFQLFAMASNGSEMREIGGGGLRSLGSLFAPHVAPDGQRLVFTRAQYGSQNIWVANVDGGEARALTGGGFNDIDPVWSPDGTQIAFASDRGARPAHWIMDADGGNMRQLPDDVARHGGRSDWSPDGRWLAFYAGPQHDRDIYLVATDGSGQTRRLTNGGRNLAPSFSPDGQWIVFTSYREGDDAEIFIMRADGTEVRQVTFNERPDWQPRWGP